MSELEMKVNTSEEVETADVNTGETDVVETDAGNELARLKAEMAKQKAALDKATKEAGDYKKQLRAKQSAEEIAAEEKRIADEARDKELADLRKRFAVTEASKKLLAIVGDETASNNMAEYLYGADDVDAAIAEFAKAWSAKEKALRLEFGKIPAPGVGGSDGPTVTREQLDEMKYTDRLKFATEHPNEYNKLMGR